MATLQYTLVFSVMVAEICGFFLLILPMPERWKRGMFKAIGTSKIIKISTRYLLFIYGFIGLLLLDSIQKVKRSNDAIKQAHLQGMDSVAPTLHATKVIMLSTFNLIRNILEASQELDKTKINAMGDAYSKSKEEKLDEKIKMLRKELDETTQDIEKYKKMEIDYNNLKKQTENSYKEFIRLSEQHESLQNEQSGQIPDKKDK
ncbi:hypothetical protein BB559_001966 [Furculomyces boomerangus]|uniref:BAP29/BAP31 transmembrane domain-containing protein n=1 Tax=Furculomyces boomerangus TaxID=61424 RepID=A0A2T9YYZ1_9FUNG|nr:hypothetical protein BB559_001966 [Furculomyces boomerangus]